MRCPIFQVDAFTDKPLAGNPAAVCLLSAPVDEQWMQRVAAEMNLSETAFVRPVREGRWELRWFTPTVEVPLCGHATLAAAQVLWETGRVESSSAIVFTTLHSGELVCRLDGSWIHMDFPADEPRATAEQVDLRGVRHKELLRTREDLMVVLETEQAVTDYVPDVAQLRTIQTRGILITARANAAHRERYQFVSRFFAPRFGIDEDPVTGSAHCALAAYWCAKLGATKLTGYQTSKRGGIVRVALHNGRIDLAGQAVTVLRGELDA